MQGNLYAIVGVPDPRAKRRDKKPFVRLFTAADDDAARAHGRLHHAKAEWVLVEVREDFDLLMEAFPTGKWSDIQHRLGCYLTDKNARLVPDLSPAPVWPPQAAVVGVLLVTLGATGDVVSA